MDGNDVALPREPLENVCDGCGDHYTPCECDRMTRAWDERDELRDALEALVDATGKWLGREDDALTAARKLLARVYREGQ